MDGKKAIRKVEGQPACHRTPKKSRGYHFRTEKRPKIDAAARPDAGHNVVGNAYR